MVLKGIGGQGSKFSLGLTRPVGQVVSNCYSPLNLVL